MTPLETYNAFTDHELTDFVAARLPKILWRVEHKPRCLLVRDAILEEIRRRDAGKPVQEALPFGGKIWGEAT